MHDDLDITRADFNALVEVLQQSMDARGIAFADAEPAARQAGADAPRHRQYTLGGRTMLRNFTFLSLACTAVLAAHAGTVQLTVVDRDGRPAADVVVLIEAAGTRAPSAAGPVVSITQEGSRFVPTLTVVAVGTTLRFTNKDAYDHHVRAMPSGPLGAIAPAKTFELRLDAADEAPGQVDEYKPPAPVKRKANPVRSADVKVDQAGPIGIGCHIHSSMRGQVYVSPRPGSARPTHKAWRRSTTCPTARCR